MNFNNMTERELAGLILDLRHHGVGSVDETIASYLENKAQGYRRRAEQKRKRMLALAAAEG